MLKCNTTKAVNLLHAIHEIENLCEQSGIKERIKLAIAPTFKIFMDINILQYFYHAAISSVVRCLQNY